MKQNPNSSEGLSPPNDREVPRPFKRFEGLAPQKAHKVTFLLGSHIDDESLPESVNPFFTEDLDLIFLEGMAWQPQQLEYTQKISDGSFEAQTTLLGLYAYGRNHPGYRYATRRFDLIRGTGAKVVQIDYELSHPNLPNYLHIVHNQDGHAVPIRENLLPFRRAPVSAFKKQCQKYVNGVFIPTFIQREQLWAERILTSLGEDELDDGPKTAVVVLGSMHAQFAEVMSSLITLQNPTAQVNAHRTDTLPSTYIERAYSEYVSNSKVQKRTALLLVASKVMGVDHDTIEEFMENEGEFDDQELVDIVQRLL
ncbi:TPA: hypothetical protein EYO12_01630 [Candidatus Saccharibacteria bacterium]|nr:hypothetical protein [Candidatus Saccharibacteria bacterium]HIO87418.1 hypothetical protein [Candidatus Saccharibacteria bacterium]